MMLRKSLNVYMCLHLNCLFQDYKKERKSLNVYMCLHLNCLFQDYKTTAMKMSFAKIFCQTDFKNRNIFFSPWKLEVYIWVKKGKKTDRKGS